jgi:pyruvate/2-oxoglutarate dehydrogenase complex dihydrolipoamide acyltransferase (E2) component
MIRANGRLIRAEPFDVWRRYTLHFWRRPNDPTISLGVECDMARALAYLERVNAGGGPRVTVTHLVVKAIGLALARHPTLNSRVIGRRIYRMPRVTVGLTCHVHGGRGLIPVIIEDPDRRHLSEVAADIREKAGNAEREYDKLINRFSGPTLVALIWLLSTLKLRFGMNLAKLGIPDPTTAPVLVSSAGMYLTFTYTTAALPRFTGVSAMISIGEAVKRPVVIGDQITIRPMMPFCVTTDHRLIDGWELGQFLSFVRDFLGDPAAQLQEGLTGRPAAPSTSGESLGFAGEAAGV